MAVEGEVNKLISEVRLSVWLSGKDILKINHTSSSVPLIEGVCPHAQCLQERV